jgi:hypothetical protein
MTELETVLDKQADSYADYEFYNSVGDVGMAQESWDMVLYFQQRIAELTQEQ